MKKEFCKKVEVTELLKEGWEIHPSRWKFNDYEVIYYYIWSPDEKIKKMLHHSTIRSLQNNGIIGDKAQ